MIVDFLSWVFDNLPIITVLIFLLGGSVVGVFKSWANQVRLAAKAGEKKKPVPMTKLEVCQAARAAWLAYAPKEAVVDGDWEKITASKAGDYGLSLVRTFSSSGREAVLLRNGDGTKFLAIRGTDGLFDAAVDMFSLPMPAPPEGLAHAGFERMSVAIRDEFRDVIESEGRLIISGHSMGAAVSILLGNLCHEMGHLPGGIVALCAPRGSGKVHAAAVEKAIGDRLIRVTVSRDIVSLVPPWLLGARHVGDTSYFDRNGDYHADVTLGWRAADFIASCISSACEFRLVRDMFGMHSCEGAVKLVEDNIHKFKLKT